MIALILGGAPSVWAEASKAGALVWPRPQIVVAANLAGVAYGDRLDGWATLHPDELPAWQASRQGNEDYRTFTPDETPERWPGSSGLYAAQVALFEMGASGVILCGVPLEADQGHFQRPRERWAVTDEYRRACEVAILQVGGRIRSMSGWTASLFGQPTAEWVDAINISKPAQPARVSQERLRMYDVHNPTKTAQTVTARDSEHGPVRITLQPGESRRLDVDVNQARIATGLVKATPIKGKASKTEPSSSEMTAPTGHKPIRPPSSESTGQ